MQPTAGREGGLRRASLLAGTRGFETSALASLWGMAALCTGHARPWDPALPAQATIPRPQESCHITQTGGLWLSAQGRENVTRGSKKQGPILSLTGCHLTSSKFSQVWNR